MAMKSYRESIDTWFDLNLDSENRTIYMGSTTKDYSDNESGVDNFMAEFFVKGMHVLESKSDKDITIVMNNPGGDWYHGMAIFDAIKTSNCSSTIKVFGYAMSMGSIILQAADRRILMPNSRFMIHYGYNGMSGHTKIFEKWADEGKKINYEMENIYLDRMMKKSNEDLKTALESIYRSQKKLEINPTKTKIKISTEENRRREDLRVYLKDLLNFDTILTPEETISLGLADEIYQKP